jgi:hypothetical protein
VIVVADPLQIEADLAAGRLACPDCSGRLRGWGHARTRTVRQRHGPALRVRPRRVHCPACNRTRVLLPGTCLPRRADVTEVIGAALVAKASGYGHRRIAADLDRPVSTVRSWLRAARDEAHLEWLRIRGTRTAATADIDGAIVARIAPAGSRLGDALTALRAAVVAIRRRFPALAAPDWALIAVTAGGRLLDQAPSG